MALPTHDRFHQIAPTTEMVLRGVEASIDYEFKDPAVLLEALQFPGSLVEWVDGCDNQRLADIGSLLIQLAVASSEYKIDLSAGFNAHRNRKDATFEPDMIWEVGHKIALSDVMGDMSHDRECPGNFQIMEAAIKAVLGAVYVDSGASVWYANGGWKAVRILFNALGMETRK